MKPTLEVFCPFSLGKEPMDESRFFPVIEGGRGNRSVVVVPGAGSLVYRVDISLDEAAKAEEKGKLGIPTRVLKAGDTLRIPEDYINVDNPAAGFQGYPYVTVIRQY
jgi:hypothetical protein